MMRETAELRLEREGEMRERFKAPEEERKEEWKLKDVPSNK